jgi:hypothetical protein
MKRLFLVLAALGWVVPYYFFLSLLLENGLNLALLVDQLFASDISTFFAVDLVITALAFLVFFYRESPRQGMKRWWFCSYLGGGAIFCLPALSVLSSGRLQTGEAWHQGT